MVDTCWVDFSPETCANCAHGILVRCAKILDQIKTFTLHVLVTDCIHWELLEFVRLILLRINYFTFVGSQIRVLNRISIIFEIPVTHESLASLGGWYWISLRGEVDLESLRILICET